MSDFLSNLAVRSLEAAPVIQPRLPSLFEPVPARATNFAGSVLDFREGRREPPGEIALEDAGEPSAERSIGRFQARVNQPAREAIAAERAAVEIPNRSRLQPAESIPLIAPMRPAEEPPTGPAIQSRAGEWHALSTLPEYVAGQPPGPKHPHEPADRPPNSAAVRPLQESRLEPIPASPVPTFQPPPPHGSEKPRITHIELPTTFLVRPARDRTGGETHGSETDTRSESLRYSNTPENESRAKPMLSERPPVPRIEPLVTPRLETAKQAAPAHRSGSSETTIQVTIGRIEVRAIPQQASTQKARSAAPVMSLNDYLQRRSKRGGA